MASSFEMSQLGALLAALRPLRGAACPLPTLLRAPLAQLLLADLGGLPWLVWFGELTKVGVKDTAKVSC